jgi:hypothetical protein
MDAIVKVQAIQADRDIVRTVPASLRLYQDDVKTYFAFAASCPFTLLERPLCISIHLNISYVMVRISHRKNIMRDSSQGARASFSQCAQCGEPREVVHRRKTV